MRCLVSLLLQSVPHRKVQWVQIR
uniref:Uncharacterized protein n=1 Tax=Lepeophtheirus salmonis TaxID=72036 RepID=A0A0K2U2Z9_LEPSM